WAREVAEPWSLRHAEIQGERTRLRELRALAQPDPAQQLEMLRLTMRHEPATDVCAPLAAFNARNAGHALGLYIEGVARLERGEREGLALLERAMQADPEATEAACERAYAWLREQGEAELAESYVRRWREGQSA
ncbi:hypothetical protein, partial [Massilia sp. ST3]|uniref:hypothetical protein n=1 Tax=Massilia sp. ST3 TaxID=2824903 RepID=UPI001B83CCE1